MRLRVDLHVHSAASEDGCSTIGDIIAAARMKGLDGVAITDHDVRLSAQSAKAFSSASFVVIPGVEVSTDAGHLLVILPRRDFRKGIPLMEAVDQSLSDGSAVAIPHPTDPLSHGVGEPASESASRHGAIALETMNASTLTRYNRSAARLALRLSLPQIGGSDAHLAKAVGDAWTDIDIDIEGGPGVPPPESIANAIIGGWVSPSGRRTSKATYLETVLRRTMRKGSERQCQSP